MGSGGIAFWLFLAAATVAALTFLSVVVWTENRLKERKEFYRYEFRKRLVEAGKMDAASVAGLMRYEYDLRLRQGRQQLLVASFVNLGAGIGLCFGLRFIENSIWMVGLIPVSVGLCLLAYGFLFAEKPNPGLPPVGWSPGSDERE
ncbi:MAG: hypothetical protein MPN21_20335 [Thermoanaerobaculia bacterium]|nr:hypothetical protein [Thermoanaerobaculia bacterium]